MEKSFHKKNFGKINYKRKIFINKIYSNIDKCYTIFALLAPFDRTGRKTGSNENVCGIWFKIGSVAGSRSTQVMWRFERNREKRYNHGVRAVGITRLLHERYVNMSGIGGTACLHDEAAEPQCQKKKSNVVHQLSYSVDHSISMVLIHRL